MRYAMLIPCYEPGENVIGLVEALRALPGADIYLVNDGSGPEYDPIFERIGWPDVRQISYEHNRGKGFALRTGIRAICDAPVSYAFIVTADSDGQHSPADIRKVASLAMNAAAQEESGGAPAPLLLGVRDLSGKEVPLRSRFGNWFSSVYFHFVTGVTLKDTQTGLRAIPAGLFPLALETPGDRYEYEMNFLMAAADHIRTVPIRTVYEEENRGSHFHAVRDSIRIYQTPLRYMTVSLISAAVDLTLFTLLTAVRGTLFSGILTATVGARCISGMVNFILNRIWSFSSIRAVNGSVCGQAVRYLILFCTQMFLSSVLVSLLSLIPIPVTVIKMIVDAGLALFSYYAQHNWVFREKSPSCARRSAGNLTENS